MKILLVDDDRDLVDMLRYVFQRDGFTVATAYDGEPALRSFQAEAPDLIVLDLMMPKRSGFDVLQEIRRVSKVPIIVLTALGDEENTVNALDSGADDYVAKPFRPRELRARVRSLLRRGHAENEKRFAPLIVGDIHLNVKTRQVSVSGQLVRLSRIEFSLLHYFMINHDLVLTYSDLMANVWNFQYGEDDELVRVTISRLRRKIEPDPACPFHILTIPGVGYRFASSREEN